MAVDGQEHEWNRNNVNGSNSYPMEVVRQDANNTNGNSVNNNEPEVGPVGSCLGCLFCLICLGLIVYFLVFVARDDNVNENCIDYIPKQIQIESAMVSPTNLSATNTQSFWTIGFSFINTKPVTIFYRDIGVQVYRIGDSDYHWTETAKVESFHHGPKNQSNVVATVKAWPYMDEQHMEGHVMSFNVTLGLDVGCKRGNKMESRPPKKYKNKMFKCNDLKVEFGGNASEGRMYGGNPVACSELSFWWRTTKWDAYEAVELSEGLLVHWIG